LILTSNPTVQIQFFFCASLLLVTLSLVLGLEPTVSLVLSPSQICFLPWTSWPRATSQSDSVFPHRNVFRSQFSVFSGDLGFPLAESFCSVCPMRFPADPVVSTGLSVPVFILESRRATGLSPSTGRYGA
jgi:hypothetical protein